MSAAASGGVALAGSERQYDIGAERDLVIALAGVERLGAIERGIVANLRSDDEALDRLRNLRLVVYAEGEGAIGRPPAADGGGGKAALGIDEVLAARDRCDEGAVIVAPD